MKIGKKIKELRKLKKLSQERLAQLMQVDQSTISYWENNRKDATITNLEDLAKIFNVQPSYFIDEESSELMYNDKSFTMDLLQSLVDNGLIEDPNHIDKDLLDTILNVVKIDLKLIKAKK